MEAVHSGVQQGIGGMGAFENCSSLSYLDYAGSEAELDGIELPEGGWPSVGTFIIRCGS